MALAYLSPVYTMQFVLSAPNQKLKKPEQVE